MIMAIRPRYRKSFLYAIRALGKAVRAFGKAIQAEFGGKLT